MKKFAIIGSFIFCLGVIIFSIALAMGHWNIANLSTTPKYVEKTMELENQDKDIVIDDQSVEIRIGISADDKIHFSYFENERDTYDIEEFDKITVRKKRIHNWSYDFMVMNFQFPTFTLLVPANYNGKLDITTDNSKLFADHISVNDLRLATENASILLNRISVAEDLILQTSNGKIEVLATDVTGELKCRNSNAGIYLTDVSANAINADTKNHKIHAKEVQANQDITFITENGPLQIDRLSAGGNIYLGNDNAGIKGTIVGDMNDFTINAQAKNGKTNLPQLISTSDKHLTAKTSNGSIHIDFVN